MNEREFREFLEGVDRAAWPVNPAQAEKLALQYSQKQWGTQFPKVLWIDSPNDAPSRSAEMISVRQTLTASRNWRQAPAPTNWWNAEAAVENVFEEHIFSLSWGGVTTEDTPLLYDLFAAGAVALVASRGTVFVVSRPHMHVEANGNLHHEKKPAVAWYQGPYSYFLHGVEVPEHFVTREKPITLDDIGDIENQEVRRVVTERYGWKKYLKGMHGEIIDQDPVHGTLWSCRVSQNDPDWRGSHTRQSLLELKDPSTNRKYFIRVPPTRATAISARAWTFGKTVKQFSELVKET